MGNYGFRVSGIGAEFNTVMRRRGGTEARGFNQQGYHAEARSRGGPPTQVTPRGGLRFHRHRVTPQGGLRFFGSEASACRKLRRERPGSLPSSPLKRPGPHFALLYLAPGSASGCPVVSALDTTITGATGNWDDAVQATASRTSIDASAIRRITASALKSFPKKDAPTLRRRGSSHHRISG